MENLAYQWGSNDVVGVNEAATTDVETGATDDSKQCAVAAIPDDDGQNEEDVWALPELLPDSDAAWCELSIGGKLERVLINWIGKFIALLALLYVFICSLDFMASAFRLLGGKTAGSVFSQTSLLGNPIAGLMIGVLATVLVQSSSTSTSIVVTMVAADILTVRPAIPIIMGANIGTSVTNTLVSLAQGSDRSEFRRAFAGATIHDMFNWLSVLILLPLEVVTHYLEVFTGYLTKNIHADGDVKKIEILKVITKPVTKLVIQLDKKIIEKIAVSNDTSKYADVSLVKHWCKSATVEQNQTVGNMTVTISKKIGVEKCKFLFNNESLSDEAIGAILLILSLTFLCICLVLIVKLLHSILRGSIARVIRKIVNANFPSPFGFLTGYVAIVVGAGMTFLVQSSSIFTSALTPLVGVGVIQLERVYPLTLGANIGTTGTGILAAMASSGDKFAKALQISLCHFFFNISGILIWYPIPLLRRVPIKMAKFLGNTTAAYRWFPLLYIVMMFFLVPALVFGVSSFGLVPLLVVLGLVFLLVVAVIALNVLQRKCPQRLPPKLRDWTFMPIGLRSLKPYDSFFSKILAILTSLMGKLRCGGGTSERKKHESSTSTNQALSPNDQQLDMQQTRL